MTLALGRIVRDVRALGWSAPVRALYEGSKRSGFHSLLFADRKTQRSGHLRTGLGVPDTVPAAARERCLADAQLIVSEGARVFGSRVKTGIHTSWHVDPLGGKSWPADSPWWRIDVRSENRLSDVKYVWEAARHRDLVVLARASYLEPEGEWLDTLATSLRRWCQECRPERGINWYSSLELALRAISWAQVLALVSERLSPDLVTDMEEQLLASARHLMVELPYTVSSMRNNHMLGDALGLIILGRLFSHAQGARRWTRIGERLFSAQLARHMRADGSMIEDSLSYHRFVVEMLCVRVLLGDAPVQVTAALAGASRHLQLLGVFECEVPQYGDWDEGRVLASSADASDLRGSAALGRVLTDQPVPSRWHEEMDELAWYGYAVSSGVGRIDESARSGSASAEGASHVDVAGGIAHAEHGPWQVWFKAGGGPSHGHADLTSVWIMHKGDWLVADPGTGTYNGSLAVRNGFRTSVAHPVMRPDDQDQLIPHRAFRWGRTARGYLGVPLHIEDKTILFGWHDAYENSDLKLRLSRIVIVSNEYVAVVDGSDGDADHWQLTIPLHPSAAYDAPHVVTEHSRISAFGLADAVPHRAEESPFLGWHSPTYGELEPATWLACSSTSSRRLWGFGNLPPLNSGGPPVVDGLSFDVGWSDSAAELTVNDDHDGARYVVRVTA